MSTIEAAAAEFLAQPYLAVAGVSSRRETPANAIYRALRKRGTTVFAISPAIDEFLGDRCYHDVQSLPRVPDGIVIVTRPEIAESLIRECAAAGIRRIWLHNMLGTRPRFLKSASAKITSVPASAIEICRSSGITVIPGSCPMQFIGDLGHRCMRGMLRITGALEAPA